MKNLSFLALLILLFSCSSREETLGRDSRYTGGTNLLTGKKTAPRFFHYGDYLFVTGADSSNRTTLGLFYQGEEIFGQDLEEGSIDSIVQLKLNADETPDFLIHYCFNEDCSLGVLLSESKNNFKEIMNLASLKTVYSEDRQLLDESGCFKVKDLDQDGREDLVVNLGCKAGQTQITRWTDTLYARDICAKVSE